jgi:hypothetical protein
MHGEDLPCYPISTSCTTSRLVTMDVTYFVFALPSATEGYFQLISEIITDSKMKQHPKVLNLFTALLLNRNLYISATSLHHLRQTISSCTMIRCHPLELPWPGINHYKANTWPGINQVHRGSNLLHVHRGIHQI